jgi:hypothetical protein
MIHPPIIVEATAWDRGTPIDGADRPYTDQRAPPAATGGGQRHRIDHDTRRSSRSSSDTGKSGTGSRIRLASDDTRLN